MNTITNTQKCPGGGNIYIYYKPAYLKYGVSSENYRTFWINRYGIETKVQPKRKSWYNVNVMFNCSEFNGVVYIKFLLRTQTINRAITWKNLQKETRAHGSFVMTIRLLTRLCKLASFLPATVLTGPGSTRFFFIFGIEIRDERTSFQNRFSRMALWSENIETVCE